MKFSYAIGNPPYQESKNGNNHNIWPDFIKESTLISDIVCMVHPGRWAIKPKDNMKKVQNQLIELGLKSFNLFPISESCFNDVAIDGGISITLLENSYSGDITYKIDNEDKGIYNDNEMIFSNNYQEEAYNKVFKNITTNMMRYIIGRPGKYGTSGGYNKSLLADKLQDTIENLKEPIKIWASKGFGKGESKFSWYFIEKDLLIDPEPNIFKTRKVMLDSKGHAIAHGKGNVINNLPVICDRNVTGNAVFFVIPKTERERELQLIKSLFMTKTARYLMCITQDSLHVRGFENIPDYIELAKLLPEDELFTDEWFYKTFDFSEGLINEIETRVSPKVEK